MEFALVGALVTLLLAAVLQLALVLHVRSTLIDCAAEGARHGALLGSSPGAGAQRARDLISAGLAPTYAHDVSARVTVASGAPTLEVTAAAPLPVLGLLGPAGVMSVTGRAILEGEV